MVLGHPTLKTTTRELAVDLGSLIARWHQDEWWHCAKDVPSTLFLHWHDHQTHTCQWHSYPSWISKMLTGFAQYTQKTSPFWECAGRGSTYSVHARLCFRLVPYKHVPPHHTTRQLGLSGWVLGWGRRPITIFAIASWGKDIILITKCENVFYTAVQTEVQRE